MKRKVLAAMALAVTISAVPLTAYASATVSDSTSVNTESQVNSESQDSVATPASGDASTPTPVGAYGGRKEIMQMVSPCGPVYQAGTLSGNPRIGAARSWSSAVS